LHEVITMLEEDENLVSADVYITPPDQGELTDQDSGPEDDCGQMDNLARGQLRSTAEAVIHNHNGIRRVGEQESQSDCSGGDGNEKHDEQLCNNSDRFVFCNR